MQDTKTNNKQIKNMKTNESLMRIIREASSESFFSNKYQKPSSDDVQNAMGVLIDNIGKIEDHFSNMLNTAIKLNISKVGKRIEIKSNIIDFSNEKIKNILPNLWIYGVCTYDKGKNEFTLNLFFGFDKLSIINTYTPKVMRFKFNINELKWKTN